MPVHIPAEEEADSHWAARTTAKRLFSRCYLSPLSASTPDKPGSGQVGVGEELKE